MHEVKAEEEFFVENREEEKFESAIYSSALAAAEELGVEESVPRVTVGRRQLHRANAPSESGQNHYYRYVVLLVVRTYVKEIEHRNAALDNAI